MSENTVKELFRSLERTVAERLRVIDDLMRLQPAYTTPLPAGPTRTYMGPTGPHAPPVGPTGCEPWSVALVQRISSLEAEVRNLRAELDSRGPLIPQYPMSGIEVIPKKEVVITETAPEPLSVADRLLLNTSALKALEQDEQEEEEAQEAQEAQEAEEEEEAEAEAEPDAEEGEELEEFEYKGATYYRDGDNNVFMADEEGELVTTPVGVWSEVKKRIITKKAE